MYLITDNYRERRRAEQSPRFDIPPLAGQTYAGEFEFRGRANDRK